MKTKQLILGHFNIVSSLTYAFKEFWCLQYLKNCLSIGMLVNRNAVFPY